MRKYSKSSKFYLHTKNELFTKNDVLLEKSLTQNKLYRIQPQRVYCKLCQSRLPPNIDFTSHGIDYIFCEACSHMNGSFDDTKVFVENLYIDQDGENYAKNYFDKNFLKRTEDIYVPKVDFLLDSLPPNKYKILDIGCGSGYFVAASLMRHLESVGLDVSKTQVDFGNDQIFREFNKTPLLHVNEGSFFESIVETNADVISAIGVIEHLREPHNVFRAFRKSQAEYIFYSVPMFSLSVILENIFTGIFPRQLSGGHTHLFTEDSINKMNELLGVRSIAEWRFGTDSMDLYRHILISLQANNSSPKMIDFFTAGFDSNIDKIQKIFDKSHFCSEIHLVASKR